jgi:mRNA-degrading endonuclease RelE of RelBE toxin-antitoxin system
LARRIEEKSTERHSPVSSKGYFKLRIGDYRVVYSKKQDAVLILRIRNRSKVYR